MTSNPSALRSDQLPPAKSRPTTSSTKASAHSVPPRSRSSAPLGQSAKRPAPVTQIDLSNAKNDRATAALIRRVLCSQFSGHGSDQSLPRERATPQPLEELLPPLTSSNEVDLQLYALIAIVMREFVFAWYSKITADNNFAEELIQVAAHCTRALEQRMRRIDLDALLLDEIPSLIEAHIHAYRTALQSSRAAQSKVQFRTVYHSLSPHRALSPVPDVSDPTTVSKQKEVETIYRQLLAQGIFAVLLPTEDLENVCFRTVSCDILADLLFGAMVNKMCEGWFVWGTVTKLVSELKTAWLEQDSREGSLGTFGHGTRDDGGRLHSGRSRLSSVLWGFVQYCYLIYVSIRFVVMGLLRVASTPPSFVATPPGCDNTSSPAFASNPAKGTPGSTEGGMGRLPVIKYRLFGMLAQLADIPRRMPWLGGLLALVQHHLLARPGRLGESGGVIDGFLRETIQNYLLTSSLLPTLLLSIRATLFPGNARPPSTPPPQQQSSGSDLTIDTLQPLPRPNRKSGHTSPGTSQPSVVALRPASMSVQPSETQIRGIKRDCASSLASLIPHQVALTIFSVRGKTKRLPATPSGVLSSSQTQPARADNNGIPPPTAPLPPFPAEDTNAKVPPGAQSGRGLERSQRSGMSDQDAGSVAGPTRDDMLANLHPQSSAQTTEANDNGGGGGGGGGGEARRRVGDDDDQQHLQVLSAIESDILDLFSDSYCNKHLVFAIIEAVVVKVIPELADHSVAELMADRGL